jgi:hypothetical protein
MLWDAAGCSPHKLPEPERFLQLAAHSCVPPPPAPRAGQPQTSDGLAAVVLVHGVRGLARELGGCRAAGGADVCQEVAAVAAAAAGLTGPAAVQGEAASAGAGPGALGLGGCGVGGWGARSWGRLAACGGGPDRRALGQVLAGAGQAEPQGQATDAPAPASRGRVWRRQRGASSEAAAGGAGSP